MIVAKQRANPDKNIAKLASEIVSKWKTMVEAEKNKRKGGTPKLSSVSSPKHGSSPAPAATSSEGKGWIGTDSSKRKWEADGVDIKRTGQPTRDNCIGLIYNGLAFMSEESNTRIILKAIEVERAAFTHYKGDNADYRNKLRSLFQNLKNKSNRELGPRIMRQSHREPTPKSNSEQQNAHCGVTKNE